MTKESKKVTRGARRKCCFVGCETNDKNQNSKMSMVKTKPKRSWSDMSDAKVDSIKRVM